MSPRGKLRGSNFDTSWFSAELDDFEEIQADEVLTVDDTFTTSKEAFNIANLFDSSFLDNDDYTTFKMDRRKLVLCSVSAAAGVQKTEVPPEEALKNSRVPNIVRDYKIYETLLNKLGASRSQHLSKYAFTITGTLSYSTRSVITLIIENHGGTIHQGQKSDKIGSRTRVLIRGYNPDECEIFSKNPILNSYPSLIISKTTDRFIHDFECLHIIDEFILLRFIVDERVSFFDDDEITYKNSLQQKKRKGSDMFFDESMMQTMQYLTQVDNVGSVKAYNIFMNDVDIHTHVVFDKTKEISYLQLSDVTKSKSDSSLEENDVSIDSGNIEVYTEGEWVSIDEVVTEEVFSGQIWKNMYHLNIKQANKKTTSDIKINDPQFTFLWRRLHNKENIVYIPDYELTGNESVPDGSSTIVQYDPYNCIMYTLQPSRVWCIDQNKDHKFTSEDMAKYAAYLASKYPTDWKEKLFEKSLKKLTNMLSEKNIDKLENKTFENITQGKKFTISTLKKYSTDFTQNNTRVYSQKPEILGSFRRNFTNENALCGDMDILLSVRNPFDKGAAIDEYVSNLRTKNYKVIEINNGQVMRRLYVELDEGSLRVDVKVCWHNTGNPYKHTYEYHCMKMHQTGSAHFNQFTSTVAKDKNLLLDQYSLREQTFTGKILAIKFDDAFQTVSTALFNNSEEYNSNKFKAIYTSQMWIREKGMYAHFWYDNLPLCILRNNTLKHYVYNKSKQIPTGFMPNLGETKNQLYEWDDENKIFATFWCETVFVQVKSEKDILAKLSIKFVDVKQRNKQNTYDNSKNKYEKFMDSRAEDLVGSLMNFFS